MSSYSMLMDPFSLESIEHQFVRICEPGQLHPVPSLIEKCVQDLQLEYQDEYARCYKWSELKDHPPLVMLLKQTTDSLMVASICAYREYGCDMRLTLPFAACPKQKYPKVYKALLHAPSLGFVSRVVLAQTARDRALKQTRVEYNAQLRLLLDMHRRYSSEHQLSQRSSELERQMLCDATTDRKSTPYVAPDDGKLSLPELSHAVYQHTVDQRLLLRKIEAELKLKVEHHGENTPEWDQGGRAAVDDKIADQIKRIQHELATDTDAWVVYKERSIRHHKVLQSSQALGSAVAQWTQRLQNVLKWFSKDRLSDYIPEEHRISLVTARKWSQGRSSTALLEEIAEVRKEYLKASPNPKVECSLWIKCVVSCIRLTQWNYLTQALAHMDSAWNTALPAIRIETMTNEITKMFREGLKTARAACDQKHLEIIIRAENTWRQNVYIPIEAWSAYVRSNPFKQAAETTLQTMEHEYLKIEVWIDVKTQCVSHIQDLRLEEWMKVVRLDRQGAGIGCRLSSPKFTDLYQLIAYIRQQDTRNRPIHLGQWIRALAFLCVGTFLHAPSLLALD